MSWVCSSSLWVCTYENVIYHLLQEGKQCREVKKEAADSSSALLRLPKQRQNLKQEGKHWDSCCTVHAEYFLLKPDLGFDVTWIKNESKVKWEEVDFTAPFFFHWWWDFSFWPIYCLSEELHWSQIWQRWWGALIWEKGNKIIDWISKQNLTNIQKM